MQYSLNIYYSCRKFKDLAEFLPNVLTGLKLEFLLFSEIFPRSDFNRSTIWKVGDFEKKHSYQGYRTNKELHRKRFPANLARISE